jgi:hypothetical protein
MRRAIIIFVLVFIFSVFFQYLYTFAAYDETSIIYLSQNKK